MRSWTAVREAWGLSGVGVAGSVRAVGMAVSGSGGGAGGEAE